jgi:hypothetical protein
MATPPPPTPPSAGSGSAAATGSGSATGGEVALPTGTPIKLGDLAKIQLAKPAGAPDSGSWQDVGDIEADGYRSLNFVDKDQFWYALQIIDCRAKEVKDATAKTPAERSYFQYCFAAPSGKWKDYPQYTPIAATDTVIKAGNLIIDVGLGAQGAEKLQASDTAAFMEKLDVAAISKL